MDCQWVWHNSNMGTTTDGNQTLLESHPEIAAQANGWDPSTVSPGSGRKLS